MNKEEFITRLEGALDGVSSGEKEEALQYYRDYFEDAGPEKEEEIIESLGSPEEVAKNIKEEGTFGEFTETGFKDGSQGNQNAAIVPSQRTSNQNSGSQNTNNNTTNTQSSSSSDSTTTAVIVLVAILTSPFWIPVVCSIVGVILSCIGCFIGFAITGVALALAAIAAFVFGIVCLFGEPAIGAIIIGTALILGVISILFILLTVIICRYFIPFLVDCLKKFWNWLFKRKKEGAVA